MRAKRARQYRKMMQQFSIQFGFREPYQVLVDADLVRDAARFSMDLQPALERTLHGKVKIMISQCSMRHLYAKDKEPGTDRVIQQAKTFERRYCGHKPEDHPEPLLELECLVHCVDRKGKGANKDRYSVASQDPELRQRMREIPGVPLIYIKRSVMVMEPPSQASVRALAKTETSKFTSEITKGTGKRKRRAHGQDSDEEAGGDKAGEKAEEEVHEKKKRKRNHGVKGPNPLSIKKPKKKKAEDRPHTGLLTSTDPHGATDTPGKAKRKRKRKPQAQSVEGSSARMKEVMETAADS